MLSSSKEGVRRTAGPSVNRQQRRQPLAAPHGDVRGVGEVGGRRDEERVDRARARRRGAQPRLAVPEHVGRQRRAGEGGASAASGGRRRSPGSAAAAVAAPAAAIQWRRVRDMRIGPPGAARRIPVSGFRLAGSVDLEARARTAARHGVAPDGLLLLGALAPLGLAALAGRRVGEYRVVRAPVLGAVAALAGGPAFAVGFFRRHRGPVIPVPGSLAVASWDRLQTRRAAVRGIRSVHPARQVHDGRPESAAEAKRDQRDHDRPPRTRRPG